MENTNVSRVFSEIIEKTTYEDLDSALLDRMKIRFADGIGAMLEGRHGVANDLLLKLMRQYGGAPEATVVNYGDKMPALNAAMVNSMQMRSNDFEPCHAGNKTGEGTPSHIASCLNPAAFAVAEREQSSGKEIMTAVAVADDFGSRLNESMGFLSSNIFDGTGTVNGMAAAAAAAKLNKMSANEIHNTFGICVNCINGTMASTLERSLLFKFPTANAARNGIFAADLGRLGYEGLEDPINGARGFYDMFGNNPNVEKMLDDAGNIFYGEILIKPYAGCCATHQNIHAVLDATGGKAYKPEEVKEIRAHMLNNKTHIVGGILDPDTIHQPDAPFTIMATTCNAVLHGGVWPEYETPEALHTEDFRAMLGKYVQMADIDPVKDDHWASVEIELTDGTVLSAQYGKIRPGMMTGLEPLSMDYIKDKFMRNAKFGGIVSEKNAEAIWEMCLNFEQLNNINELMKLIIPA